MRPLKQFKQGDNVRITPFWLVFDQHNTDLCMIVQIKHHDGSVEQRVDTLAKDENRTVQARATALLEEAGLNPKKDNISDFYGEAYWWMIK